MLDRLSDLWWDIRNPVRTLTREAALRYCRKYDLVMVKAADAAVISGRLNWPDLPLDPDQPTSSALT